MCIYGLALQESLSAKKVYYYIISLYQLCINLKVNHEYKNNYAKYFFIIKEQRNVNAIH